MVIILLPALAGLTINRHYCHDELVSMDVNFIQHSSENNAASCPGNMQEMIKTCSTDKGNHSCPNCRDDRLKLQIKKDFLPVINKVKLNPDFEITLFAEKKVSLFSFLQSSEHFLKDFYNPPEIRRSITFLMSFLL